jgi:GTP-binding protein EngB required for normal cell division
MSPHHRPNALPQCQNLQAQVDSVLNLLQQEPSLQARVDTSAVRSSLKKAIAPTFEIVFAGAFSAGKSMLINALLERELLYSAEGHATGTECQIAYAEPEQERVVLTFYLKPKF